jgi:small conductance mechanosensitive channel
VSEFWQHVLVAGIVVLLALVLAKVLDRRLVRRLNLRPEAMTRYSVIRRTLVAAIVVVGVLSALLVIPEVQAVAGSILASSAVIALIVGFAAQSTLSNVVAGILIAFTQPIRLGDQVEVGTAVGTVEEIGLIYTLLRASDGPRFYVPNTRMASDTIRNATLQSFEHKARVTVPVPLASDLERVRDILLEEARKAPEAMPEKEPVATLSELEAASAVFTVEAWATSVGQAGKLAASVRVGAYRRLRAEGVYA